MLSEYIEIIKNSEKYQIRQKDLMSFQKMALNHLKLRNMNELRDRFEGQAYLNNFLIRAYAEKALESFLGSIFIDPVKQFNDKNYKPDFTYKGFNIKLITSTLEEYPLIPKAPFTIGCVILVNVESRSTYLAGFFHLNDIIEQVSSNPPSPLALKKNLGYLKDLSSLSFDCIKRS